MSDMSIVQNSNRKPFALRGRFCFRLRNLARLLAYSLLVSARRTMHGPVSTGCSWGAETGREFMREQFRYAFHRESIIDGRDYLDSLIFHSPALDRVTVELVDGAIRGSWYTPPELKSPLPLLFFPGGGYVFNPISGSTLNAELCLATGRRLFALNYPLAPEYPFPAQLEEAQRAYVWLIDELGIEPGSMILGGASAGGNLCLALLLSLREQRQPQPALAFLLSPWVDLGNSGESMTGNEPMDWISKETSELAARWYCDRERLDQPLVSPLFAELSALAPIYIQAGGSEIFIDMIRDFVTRAEEQSAPVQLEVWQRMIHCFQAFGDEIPESREALDRLGDVVFQAS